MPTEFAELVPVTVRQHTKANHKILRDVHELMTGPCSMSTIQTRQNPAAPPPPLPISPVLKQACAAEEAAADEQEP